MEASSCRVLVVEDSEPFRVFICSTVGKRPELQIVGQVTDGLQAVQKAEELQPDLILLDIGLPRLNGIQAAQQILRLSSKSKILFVSQESSADIVQEVFSLGACGYVVKMDAGRELLAAVDAVLRGEQFVGSRFAGHDFSGASDEAADLRSKAVAPLLRDRIVGRHEAAFYSDDSSFLDGLTHFVATALNGGSAAIVFASESHRNNLIYRLQTHGIDVTTAIDQRRYIPLDSVDILSKFMVDDLPDPVRLFKVLDDLIDTVHGGTGAAHTRVVVCGGLAPVLLNEGKPESAIKLEQLWDQVVTRYGLDTLCMYSKSSFEREQDRDVFQQICGLHSSVHSR